MTKPASAAIAAMLWLFLSPVSRAAAILEISPNTQNANAASLVSFAVNISGLDANTALSFYDLNINFDSNFLSFDQAVFGDPVLGDQLDLLHLGLNGPTATPGLGIVALSEFSFDDAATLLSQQADAFTLATLSFSTLSAGVSPITLSINSLWDTNAGNIPSSVHNGAITIDGSAAIHAVSEPESFLLWLIGGLAFLIAQRKTIGLQAIKGFNVLRLST